MGCAPNLIATKVREKEMKRRMKAVGFSLSVTFFFLFGFVNESMSAKPQVVGGGYHTLWLKSDGTLWACGYNYYGQLGDATTIERHSPVQVGSDNKWGTPSAGNFHSLGLKSDGTLWAWGNNEYGQLGDGTNTPRNSPVHIGSDNKWVVVSAGRITQSWVDVRWDPLGLGR